MYSSYRFVVTGRVQGVGFRAATRRKGQSLGLSGWVRNRNDGAVEGIVAGEEAAAIETFHQWLRQGPPVSRVEHLDWRADRTEKFTGRFEVLD